MKTSVKTVGETLRAAVRVGPADLSKVEALGPNDGGRDQRFPDRKQHGATAVEFALVASALLMLLIGIMEVGRVLFYWNSATEATRLGARIAVVCDINDANIRNKMVNLFPLLAPTASDITIDYLPTGCSAATCETVTVSIVPGKGVTTYFPFVPWAITIPTFSTTLPRESMLSSVGGIPNPVCSP